jgi:hypothetical protein
MTTIVRLLPPGIAAETIRRARQSETHPEAEPYFDGLEAEVALLRGQPEEALRLARQALAKLPAAHERTLRARVAALGAEAARRLGLDDECRLLTGAALRDFPEMFRLLHLNIPVRIEHDGSPEACRLAEQVLRSPRFREDDAGFRIVIGRSDSQLTITLFGLEQAVHCRVTVSCAGDDPVAAALHRFHARLMSPVLDLNATDVNSLGALPGRPDDVG